MEINSKNHFNQRPAKKEPRPMVSKTFIACEGSVTEVLYFQHIIKNNGLFNYFLLKPRDSHPLRILDEVIKASEEGRFESTYGVVFKEIVDAFNDEISEKMLRRQAQSFLSKKQLKFCDVIDDLIAKDFITFILKDTPFINSVEALLKIIKENEYYLPDIDRIIIVSDRDSRSFTEAQCNKTIAKCKERNYTYILTNPCIEFFFLLHWNDCQQYPIELLLDNKKTNKKTFCHRELKKYDKNYSKTKFKPDIYLEKYNDAKTNGKLFCCNLNELVNNVGTDIFALIDDLISR